MNLNEACNKKVDDNFGLKSGKNKLLNFISIKSTKTSVLNVYDELNNSTLNNKSSNHSTNYKIHILLPILLSCLLVGSLVLLLLFLKR